MINKLKKYILQKNSQGENNSIPFKFIVTYADDLAIGFFKNHGFKPIKIPPIA